MTFDPQYVSHVLNENFEDAKALFLAPLMAIHSAHLVMLADRHIISASDARTLRAALDAMSLEDIQCAGYDGTCEDLFSYVERLLVRACGEETAGRLHTARSRNDIDMTMYRMRQRDELERLIAAALALRECLVQLAARHRETVFAAHTHTQPAQPTTVAHYLLAVIEQLERDHRRLQAAYGTTNRSPLGSCAITGTGFAIDRALTSDLLGFSGPTGNTYGSIATVDYLLESVSATTVLLTGLGRVVQDLLLWCTQEFGYLRLADGFVQSSSIMPQKRNPVALEHARAIASKAVGQAVAITLSVHNTPFGDIVDTEDDLQPLVASMFRDAHRTVALLAAALGEAEFDVEQMEARAADGGTTFTELADHLVREHRIAFKTAHAIAARVLKTCRERSDASLSKALAEASAELSDASLEYREEELTHIMSPRHVVAVRSTLGGPAPPETTRALSESERVLAFDREWLAGVHAARAAAEARLRERSLAL